MINSDFSAMVKTGWLVCSEGHPTAAFPELGMFSRCPLCDAIHDLKVNSEWREEQSRELFIFKLKAA